MIKGSEHLARDREKFIYMVVLSIIPMLFLGYCQFFHNTKSQTFIELVKPLQTTCQSKEGCAKLPVGWAEVSCPDGLVPEEKALYANTPTYCAIFNLNSTGLGTVFYKTNTKNFYINWRYYSDSVFYAEGGKAQTLIVTRHTNREKTVILDE